MKIIFPFSVFKNWLQLAVLTLIDPTRGLFAPGISFLAKYILFSMIWSPPPLCIFPFWGSEGPPERFLYFFFIFDPFPELYSDLDLKCRGDNAPGRTVSI